jgi:hypothetical protein
MIRSTIVLFPFTVFLRLAGCSAPQGDGAGYNSKGSTTSAGDGLDTTVLPIHEP